MESLRIGKKNISQHNPAGASMRHRIANPLVGLPSSSLIMEPKNYCAPKFPSPSTRLPFHFPRGARLVSRWPCLCRIAVAVVVVCVEPRGPASPIGVIDIQMTAVMRREFGHSGTALIGGRARARASERPGPCPLFTTRGPLSFVLLFQSQFDQNLRK